MSNNFSSFTMKHQITHLLLAILLFAGFATSATKADEIEGTWSQEGQYKKFSKKYASDKLLALSIDKKKMAVIEYNTIKVIEIVSGKLLDSFHFSISQGLISIAISKDLKYLSTISNRETISSDSKIYTVRFNAYNIEKKILLCDTVLTYDFSDITALSSISDPELSFFKSVAYAKANYSYSFGFSYYGSGNKCYSYNCDNNVWGKNGFGSVNGSKSFYSSTIPLQIIYSISSSNTGHSGEYYTTYNESLYMVSQNSTNTLFNRSWYRSSVPSDPGEDITPYTPIGITADNKNAVLKNSDKQIILYSLEKPGTSALLKENNGNKIFTEIASSLIFFPNDYSGKNILYFSKLNDKILIKIFNYQLGTTNAIGYVDKDLISGTNSQFIIDSSNIITINSSGEMYMLDLNSLTPANGIEVLTDKQFCTTNDSVAFVVINPKKYTDIIIDFGDGTSSKYNIVSHEYAQMGHYTITVKAKDENGKEIKIIKEKYITVNQGISSNMKLSVDYLPNDQIKVNLVSNLSGNYKNPTLYIADSSASNVDSLSAIFSRLGYYYIKTTCTDNNSNKLVSMDTLLKVFGPSNKRIISENYSTSSYSEKVFLFKNNSKYESFSRYYWHKLDSNLKISNYNNFAMYTYLTDVRQLYNDIYYIKIATRQSQIQGIFDVRKDNPCISILNFGDNSTFAFSNDTIGYVNLSTNEIIYSDAKTLSILKKIKSKYKFESQPIPVHNLKSRRVDFLDFSKDNGIVLYKLTKDSIITKFNTIQPGLSKDYCNLIKQIKSSKNNTFELLDSGFVTTLNFNSGRIFKHSLPNLNIQQVVHFSDTTAALVCTDSTSTINICIVDSNYTIIDSFRISNRKGRVLLADINMQNQLEFIARTPEGNIYTCTVKISDNSIPDKYLTYDPISNDTIDIDIPLPTPIEYVKDMVYPNPVDDFLTINIALTINAKLLVTNSEGTTITPKILNKTDKSFSIRTNELSEGVYFVHIRDRGVIQSAKFVISR